MAVLGLRFCPRAFSSCGKRGPLFIAVRGPLTITVSLVAEHRLQTRRLSNCGSRAQLLRGMWDLPRPGLEPMSPVLAGRFSTTAPPGKPISPLFNHTLALPFAYKRFDGTHIREVISLKQSYIFSNIKSLFFYAPGPCPASLLCFLVIFYHQSGTMRTITLEERRADTAWFLHQLWVLNSLDSKLHEKNDFISVSCSFLSK